MEKLIDNVLSLLKRSTIGEPHYRNLCHPLDEVSFLSRAYYTLPICVYFILAIIDEQLILEFLINFSIRVGSNNYESMWEQRFPKRESEHKSRDLGTIGLAELTN